MPEPPMRVVDYTEEKIVVEPVDENNDRVDSVNNIYWDLD